ATGMGLARWGVTMLLTLFAGASGRIVLKPDFDWRVLAFTASVALLTGILFSLAPALHAARMDAAKPGTAARSSIGASQLNAGNALVVAQIGLSVALLCGAALFLRSLTNLTRIEAGFHRD